MNPKDTELGKSDISKRQLCAYLCEVSGVPDSGKECGLVAAGAVERRRELMFNEDSSVCKMKSCVDQLYCNMNIFNIAELLHLKKKR